jgi:8-oxo-dGTP diphosphatase
MKYTYDYPKTDVTADAVVFGLDLTDPPMLNVLLIQRRDDPFQGHWALPGGFWDENENMEAVARRELREETGIEVSYIEQLRTFSQPGRDPRGPVISVAHMSLVRTDAVAPKAGDDAKEVMWCPVDWATRTDLAFDHDEILGVALKRLRSKLRWCPIGIDLLPEAFSLTDLQQVYETVLGRPLDKRNFRRKVLSYDVLESAESRRIGSGPGRPPQLWRFNRNAYDALQEDGEDFEV